MSTLLKDHKVYNYLELLLTSKHVPDVITKLVIEYVTKSKCIDDSIFPIELLYVFIQCSKKLYLEFIFKLNKYFQN